MRWRSILIFLLGHVIGSYTGAGLLVVLAKEVDHMVPHSFWVLLKFAPLAAPRFVLFFLTGLDRPKALAVFVVVLGYAAAFYIVWKLTLRFRVPKSRLERGRGFGITLTAHAPAVDADSAATLPDQDTCASESSAARLPHSPA